MKISIFGLGYVGCVSAACLAKNGHEVLGRDMNRQKAELLRSGRAPVIEPGLESLIREAVDNGRLRVTFNSRAAIHESDISMICVGTPSNRNGSLDLEAVESVCREIGAGLADKQGHHVVVVRSTVLPGSTAKRLIPLLEDCSGRRPGIDFGVCVNPEFMREGSGIADYYSPGMIVIGELDQRSGEIVTAIYENIEAPKLRMSIPTAEMVKYASNAFHALKVTFANEIGVLCKAQGIDGRELMEILCQDTRLNISAAYLRPGFAFGGSCLPKDLRALLHRAKELDLEYSLLKAILWSNQQQIQRAIDLVESTGQKRIGVLGLSFKPGTDDMRESPVVALVERLIGKGYDVHVHDKEVELGSLVGTNKAFLEREIPHIASLMCSSVEEVMENAEVVVVAQGGAIYRQALSSIKKDQTLIDLVGIDSDKGVVQGAYDGIGW